MAITQNTFTGNGTTVLYSFTFPYLDQSHVKATLNGTPTTDFTFANATTLQFNSAPGAGVEIVIFRETDNDQAAAVFAAGSPIRAADLNQNNTQLLYVSQESSFIANEASTTADTALSQVSSSFILANQALATANQAQLDATAAVNTSNQAQLDATDAVNTADAADLTSQAAVVTANAALVAVAAAVAYQPVANLAALALLTPSNAEFFELQDSTGADTDPSITGIPVGLVGAPGLTFRLRYDDPPGEYVFLSPRNALGRHYDNTTAFSQFKWIGGRARGNRGNPSAVLNNDSLVSFNAKGYKATGWSNTVGGLYVYAAENWTDTATGTYITLRGAATGGTAVTEWARLTSTNASFSGTVTATSFSGSGANLTGIEAFPSGTVMLFQQTTAPTGWTKLTTHNDKALRIVSGTVGSGGATAFSAVMNGSVGATTLTTAQIPSHNHAIGVSFVGSGLNSNGGYAFQGSNVPTTQTGGGDSHTHSMNVAYVDVIMASKD
jgi:hypothetical protein